MILLGLKIFTAGLKSMANNKVALITGITGQDGPYLAQLLLERGYDVFGTSRDASMSTLTNLYRLNIHSKVTVMSMAINDFRSVLKVMTETKPDEVYNLAGQSSVYLSFEQPIETLESNIIGTLNLLECIRILDRGIRFFNASSGDCFGNTGELASDEKTPFSPCSPYGVAKAAAFWEVANYRDAYNLYACSGILFNHESPLRPERFVTQKIVSAACRIARGDQKKLNLGNLNVHRDWGLSSEYVDAMWLMLQQESPDDYVIATGKTYRLDEFVAEAFRLVGLDWRKYVEIDDSLLRLTDLTTGRANPGKAKRNLDWVAKSSMFDVIKLMVEEKQKL
jgi:GDPmannose 4,6-dehydratase